MDNMMIEEEMKTLCLLPFLFPAPRIRILHSILNTWSTLPESITLFLTLVRILNVVSKLAGTLFYYYYITDYFNTNSPLLVVVVVSSIIISDKMWMIVMRWNA